MRAIPAWPTVNAGLNAAAALALGLGYLAIRRRRIAVHRASMLAACGLSALFLASYVAYHARIGSRPFGGIGWIRVAYFALLLSHTGLAAAIVPLVAVTLVRALRGEFPGHARLARWTLPLWGYVSVTGVLVYWMLYWR